MCTGRIDLAFIVKAFLEGADGVYIAGCKLNECNYTTQGNFYALNISLLFKRIMEHIGIKKERLKIDFLSSSEGQHFAETVSEFIKTIRDIGPIGEIEQIDSDELYHKLSYILELVPYLKIATRDKLLQKISDESQWDGLFTLEEVQRLINEPPVYWIDPERCAACTLCAQRCPVDAIDGGKNKIHIIIQEKCIRCGTCFAVCPSKFSAVKKLSGEKAPDPIPEEKRVIKRAQTG